MGKLLYAITAATLPQLTDASPALKQLDLAEGLVLLYEDTDQKKMRPSRKNMLAYQQIQEALLTQTPSILPMRFGTIATETKQDVQALLAAHHDQLRERLTYLTGRQEFSLKVSWTMERLLARVRANNPELVAAAAPTDINAQINLGQLVEQGIAAVHTETRTALLDALNPYCVEIQEMDAKQETTSLDAALLIDADKRFLMDSVIETCDDDFDGVLLFKIVGPLPPYSFVNIAINLNDDPEDA